MTSKELASFLIFYYVALAVLGAIALLMRGRLKRTVGASIFAFACVVLLTPLTLAGLGGLGSPAYTLSVVALPLLNEPNSMVRDAIMSASKANCVCATVIATLAFIFAKTVLFGRPRPQVRNVLVAPLIGAAVYASIGLSVDVVLAPDSEFVEVVQAHLLLAAVTFLIFACYAYPLRFRVFSASQHRIVADAIIVLIPIALFAWMSSADLILFVVFLLPFVGAYWVFVRFVSAGGEHGFTLDGA